MLDEHAVNGRMCFLQLKAINAMFKCWDSRLELSLSKTSLTPRTISSLKAEHVRALITGDPFGCLFQQDRMFIFGTSSSRIAYSEGVVAWIGNPASVIRVRNLCSGDFRKFSYDVE